jgi:hypothetical protein
MGLPKVNLLHSEDHDWVGIYVDDKLVEEGHSFTPEMVLEAIGVKHQSLDIDFEAADWGSCPRTYAEVEAHLAAKGEAIEQG